MRPGREELRDTRSVEASFSETKGRSQTRPPSADNDGVILVIDDGVFLRDKAGCLLRPQIAGAEYACRGSCR